MINPCIKQLFIYDILYSHASVRETCPFYDLRCMNLLNVLSWWFKINRLSVFLLVTDHKKDSDRMSDAGKYGFLE